MRDTQRCATREPLEIADALDLLPDGRAQRGLGDQDLHGVLPVRDRRRVEQRPEQPLAERPRAHRRGGPVDDGQERAAWGAILGVLEQLERRHCGRVQRHGVARVKTLEPGEMAERLTLGVAQVGQGRARRLEPRGHVRHAQAVERLDLEVRSEQLARRAKREPRRLPARHHHAARGETGPQARVLPARHEALGRPAKERRVEERRLVRPRAFPGPEVARGHVDESHAERAAGACPGPMQGEEIVVGCPLEVARIGQRAGRDDTDHLSPDELLALGGCFHLLAHRHLPPGPYEPRDVAVGGMVRNAGHRNGAFSLLARCQRDLKQARALVGVLEEELVEVAQTEEQQVVRVALLELPVLPHHWGKQLGRQLRGSRVGKQVGRGILQGPSAARRRSYVVSRLSGKTRVSLTTGMKFVSPLQRGTM